MPARFPLKQEPRWVSGACLRTNSPRRAPESLIGLRSEYGLLNYLNLFVNHQIRSGRYQELYNKHVGEGDAPNLMIPGAYY